MSTPTPPPATKIFMKCGCTSQGTINGVVGCLVHNTTEQALAPDLTGRVAVCAECTDSVASSLALPFFSHRPEANYDSYYSGCRGWE